MNLLRTHDELGYVIPYCQLCMKELKLGEKMIMTHIYSLVHASCGDQENIMQYDRGEFSEVVKRNFTVFPDFVKQFNEMGIYKR